MKIMSTLQITNYTRHRIPKKSFSKALAVTLKVLKKKVPTVELIFINEKISKEINALRGKRKPSNVLSFQEQGAGRYLSLGQIFITPSVAKSEAREKHMVYGEWLIILFVHSLLHLFGFSHKKMSPMEKKILRALFKF